MNPRKLGLSHEELRRRIAANIYEARIAANAGAGMTQAELADAAGLSRDFIGDLENEKRDVSTGNLLAIANALDVDMESLIAKTPKKKTRR